MHESSNIFVEHALHAARISLEPRPNDRALVIKGLVTTTVEPPLTVTSATTTIIFLADSPFIDSCLNLSTTVTSLQWLLSPVPKVAALERFNCICKLILAAKKPDEIKKD